MAEGISFGPLGMAVDALHALMQWSVTWLGEIDGSAIRDIYITAWVILPYSIGVVMLALAIHYRKRTLWITTATMAVAIFITAGLTRERLPAAEMYIPSGLAPASVIMRAGDKAWIHIPGEKDGGSALVDANMRYRRFLMSREVAILVDEYDKPLLGIEDNPEQYERNLSLLKGFFSNLKSMDEHIRFAILTGVARFSKVSIFSDLNNLKDISMYERYQEICGWTEEDLLAVGLGTDNVMALMFQTGYLTIDSYEPLLQTYTLRFPNREVETGFAKFLLPLYAPPVEENRSAFNVNIFKRDLYTGDPEAFMERLATLVKDLPWEDQNESTYRAVTYLLCLLSGTEAMPERHSYKGKRL